jgi:hypothetical protein
MILKNKTNFLFFFFHVNIMNFLYIIIIIVFLYFVLKNQTQSPNIEDLTNSWINSVTVDKSPQKVANHFCNDGILFGTVSQTLRKGINIEKYFDYFAKLPGLKVVDKQFNIDKISSNVYVNNAFITWQWDGVNPVVARMTFIYRDNCIFELHSSTLPDKNIGLKKVS